MLRGIQAYVPTNKLLTKYKGRLMQQVSLLSTIDSNNNNNELLITNKVKNCLTITINRPKALNSLNLEICQQMNNLLLNVINKDNKIYIDNHHINEKNDVIVDKSDDYISVFILKGSGNKAFCAGGDVKSIWSELNKLNHINNYEIGSKGYLHNDFFRTEYLMNYLLEESLVPQVSFWDGIVMGGGVGISIFGEYRIATENTIFAMPETTIGLIPDVGGSSWLPHIEHGIGNYIALTGCRLYAKDLINTKIATHFISSKLLPEVELALKNTIIPRDPKESRKIVKSILDSFEEQSEQLLSTIKSSLLPYESIIHTCFDNVTDLDMIYNRLNEELATANTSNNNNDTTNSITNTTTNTTTNTISDNNIANQQLKKVFIEKTLQDLSKLSPMSLQLTMEQLKRGKKLDLKGCLRMEYRVMMHCIHSNDFKEGIRALLIDKDNNPLWNPVSYKDINKDMINKYFESLQNNDFNIFDHSLYPHLNILKNNESKL